MGQVSQLMLKELCVREPQMICSPQVLTVVNFAVKSSLGVCCWDAV